MANGHGGAREGAGAKPRTVADASGEAHVIYTKARAKREQHNAALAELQLREKEGDLVDASQMRKEADAAARKVKNAFLAMPERIASILVGRTEKDILFELRREVRSTLELIADDV